MPSITCEHRLTSDALPYKGYGMMTAAEYAAHLVALRFVRDEEARNGHGVSVLPGDNATITSFEYQAGIVIARAGLVEQGGHFRMWRLTAYGHLYVSQRS